MPEIYEAVLDQHGQQGHTEKFLNTKVYVTVHA